MFTYLIIRHLVFCPAKNDVLITTVLSPLTPLGNVGVGAPASHGMHSPSPRTHGPLGRGGAGHYLTRDRCHCLASPLGASPVEAEHPSSAVS